MKNSINELCKAAYENAVSKGFYENPPSIAERIALIHSEASEALECDRKEQFCVANAKLGLSITNDEIFQNDYQRFVKETFEAELADIVIRVFDLAGSKGIDLESHILAKMRYNSLRPHKHGKKY